MCCVAHTHPHRDWPLEGAGLVGEPLCKASLGRTWLSDQAGTPKAKTGQGSSLQLGEAWGLTGVQQGLKRSTPNPSRSSTTSSLC